MKTGEIKIAWLRKLRLNPGDIFVVRVPKALGHHCQHIEKALKGLSAFKGVSVLVMCDRYKIKVFHRGKKK